MSSNDVIILDKILEQRKAVDAPSLSESAYFEIFSASQILKDFDLSYDEIESGIVGSGGDGGLDSIYLFVNGDLVQEDTDLSALRRDVTIELSLIQSKTARGFSETQIAKFQSATDDLLDLSRDLRPLAGVYNANVINTVNRFREVYGTLASRLPKLTISYFYASKGSEIHPNVRRKVDLLEQNVKRLFSAVNFQFQFIGASELLELIRRLPRTTYSLSISENPISSSGSVAFVCLVSLAEFFKFITDEHGQLRRNIFDANVRDYQGQTQVNEEIQATLKEREATEEFWWLNNGVSILASRATLSGKIITMEDPQIVNGLQTSTELYKYFRSQNTVGEQRNVLVRVIVPAGNESRDRIIKATNNQTPIPIASLRSTEKIHRDIEEFFRSHGLFYDRRKNLHKNEGKPIEKIVSIPYLAQALMAIALQRPDSARARPSSLLKKDEEYEKVFSIKHPIQLYVSCANLMKRVDKFIRSEAAGLEQRDQTNLRFYVAMDIGSTLTKHARPSAKELAALQVNEVADDMLRGSLEFVRQIYTRLGGSDQTAKGTDLLKELVSSLETRFSRHSTLRTGAQI